MASDVTSKAGASWTSSRTSSRAHRQALGKLGVPTAKDVAELARRVEELSAAVAKLSKSPKGSTGAAPKAAAKAPAKKAATAGRKSPAKKAAASNGAAKPAAKRAAARKAASAAATGNPSSAA